MRLTRGTLITLLAALAASVVASSFAQTEDKTPKQEPQIACILCPTVTVSCQETGLVGQLITFTANIAGGDPNVTPTFKWTVPDFNIMSGEDTSEMNVGTPAQGGKMVATVEIGGYPRECSMTASCTTLVVVDPSLRKVGEYIGLVRDDEKAQLFNFAGELENEAAAWGYLLCYGGRRSAANEAQRRCERARNYLSTTRGIAADRLAMVDAGFREEPTVELWVVPPGVSPPQATPTVDPQEVRPPPPPPRKVRRGRS
ncbi:MAG: hypothetical protein JOZ02_04080 [Acidobacteria bacterium]|nr:hypothetical protein [Acidobacteriota bacterium]